MSRFNPTGYKCLDLLKNNTTFIYFLNRCCQKSTLLCLAYHYCVCVVGTTESDMRCVRRLVSWWRMASWWKYQKAPGSFGTSSSSPICCSVPRWRRRLWGESTLPLHKSHNNVFFRGGIWRGPSEKGSLAMWQKSSSWLFCSILRPWLFNVITYRLCKLNTYTALKKRKIVFCIEFWPRL